MKKLYTLRNEYGTFLAQGSYDTMCRVAHYARMMADYDFFVVGPNGRACSEVVDIDPVKDSIARDLALELMK